MRIVPLNCRGGCYFWLDPKVTKRSSQQKGFFAAQGLCPANSAKPGLETIAHSLIACPSANIPYALQPHMATIVLPDFARSCSADGHRITMLD
jgi:hypothetical protein